MIFLSSFAFALPFAVSDLIEVKATDSGRMQGILKGEVCTTDLLFDWFGLISFANKNKNCQLPYS
jgi:hypothetical protein